MMMKRKKSNLTKKKNRRKKRNRRRRMRKQPKRVRRTSNGTKGEWRRGQANEEWATLSVMIRRWKKGNERQQLERS